MMNLTEMTNRELFCVLTGDRGVLAQAQLQDMLLRYKAAHPEQTGEIDLSAVVAEMAAEG